MSYWLSFISANFFARFTASERALALVPVACADSGLPPPLPPITWDTCWTHSFALRPLVVAT